MPELTVEGRIVVGIHTPLEALRDFGPIEELGSDAQGLDVITGIPCRSDLMRLRSGQHRDPLLSSCRSLHQIILSDRVEAAVIHERSPIDRQMTKPGRW